MCNEIMRVVVWNNELLHPVRDPLSLTPLARLRKRSSTETSDLGPRLQDRSDVQRAKPMQLNGDTEKVCLTGSRCEKYRIGVFE